MPHDVVARQKSYSCFPLLADSLGLLGAHQTLLVNLRAHPFLSQSRVTKSFSAGKPIQE